MTNGFAGLPMMVKVSALCMGAPLVLTGVMMMLGDVAKDLTSISRSHVLVAGPHFGLAMGFVFAVVGGSFLWPLRPFHLE